MIAGTEFLRTDPGSILTNETLPEIAAKLESRIYERKKTEG